MRTTNLVAISLTAAAAVSAGRPELDRMPLTFERNQGQEPALACI